MRIQILFLILVQCTLSSCGIRKGKESSKPPILKLLISISTGPCRGKCSQFSAEIFTGQKMLFHGISRTPVSGKYAYLIPEKLSQNLLAETQRLKLSELPDSLESPEGEQRIRIRFLKKDGQYKAISCGIKSSPPAFAEFVKRLQMEVIEMVSDQEGEKIP